jgi:hypothetical protein
MLAGIVEETGVLAKGPLYDLLERFAFESAAFQQLVAVVDIGFVVHVVVISTTGRTVTPDAKGQLTPQGWTGPINTTSGGAPASSPPCDTPPGMQSAPEGSSKTVAFPDKKWQTPKLAWKNGARRARAI